MLDFVLGMQMVVARICLCIRTYKIECLLIYVSPLYIFHIVCSIKLVFNTAGNFSI